MRIFCEKDRRRQKKCQKAIDTADQSSYYGDVQSHIKELLQNV